MQKRLATKLGRIWFVAAAGLPLLILSTFLVVFAVNVPFWDQWELVTLFQKHHDGTLAFSDFFAQHNEHRLLFPRLVMYGLAVMSHWNTYWEVAASVILAAAGIFFLYKIVCKTIAHNLLRLLALFSISLIFFSPLQQENWLWGWQIQWYLCILGLIVAVWALAAWESSPLKRVIVAALAAAVATYSLASGFFVWIVCLPLLWFIRPLRRWLLLWLGLMITAIGVHYIGDVDPAYHPSKTLFLDQPFQFVKYVVVYLAHPVTIDFAWSYKIAVLYFGGISAVLIYMYRRYREQLVGSLLPWLCLGAYAVFAALSTGMSRLGFGVEQAFSSRYTTLAQFLLIAFVVVLCKMLEPSVTKKSAPFGWASKFAVAGFLVTMLFVGLNAGKGLVQMQLKSDYLQQARQCAHTATSVDDPCLFKLYPNETVVWERLQYIRHIHWGGL